MSHGIAAWATEGAGFENRQVEEIYLHSKMFRPTKGNTQPPIQWTSSSLSQTVKLLGLNSPASSADVKNEWSYTSIYSRA